MTKKRKMTKTIDGVVAKYEIREERRDTSVRIDGDTAVWRNYFANAIPYHN